MSTAQKSALKVGPTDQGCCIRVEGAGTVRQSQAAANMAAQTLGGSSDAVVVIDLSECDYLDSTFIGCLLELHRLWGTAKPPRCVLAGSSQKVKQLVTVRGADRVLSASAIDAPPAVRGDWVVLAHDNASRAELMRHVMECHRALAQLDTPMKKAFAKIADGIERDLGKAAPHA